MVRLRVSSSFFIGSPVFSSLLSIRIYLVTSRIVIVRVRVCEGDLDRLRERQREEEGEGKTKHARKSEQNPKKRDRTWGWIENEERKRETEKGTDRETEREREYAYSRIFVCSQTERETAQVSERVKESECARARVNECVYTLTRHTSGTHASKRQYQPKCITKPTDRAKYKANPKKPQECERPCRRVFSFFAKPHAMRRHRLLRRFCLGALVQVFGAL